jgi:diguanylate cyclase (GGDEF)-like protein
MAPSNQVSTDRQSPTRLVAGFVLLVCLCLFGFVGWKAWEGRASRLAQAMIGTENLARSLAQNASRTIGAVDLILTGLAERIEHDQPGPELATRIHALLEMRVKGSQQIRELAVLDAAGSWLYSSLPTLPIANNSDRGYFIFHRDHPGAGLLIDLPLISRTSGRWTIIVSRRVNDRDGGFAGIALAAIDLGYFQAFYDSLTVGRKTRVALFRSDGRLLVSSPFNEANLGRDYAARPMFSGGAPSGSEERTFPSDGIVRLLAYEKLSDYPLLVSVARAEDDILAPWWAGARVDAEVAGVTSLVIALLGALIAFQLRRSQRMTAEKLELLQKIDATERRVSVIFKSMPGVVYERHMTPDGKISYLFASDGIEKLLGVSFAEAKANSDALFERIDPTHRQALLASIRESAATLELWQQDFPVILPAGERRWIRATSMPRRLDDGTTVWDGVAIDITDQKDLQHALEAARATAESGKREMAEMAVTDMLTQLGNRRSLQERLTTELASAARSRSPLGIVLFDVDRFKPYNDTYGHLAGDACLRQVADMLRASARRPRDFAARFGGEEFVLILPDLGLSGALGVAERIRAEVQAIAIEHRGSEFAVVTVSGGVIVPDDDTGYELERVMKLVDDALYRAKAAGRNRVMAAETAAVAPPAPIG